jgi:hypothetical protein
MLKGDSLGVSPAPNQDPALSAKVTTGGLSAPVSRWIDGSRAPVQAPVLGNEEPHASHYGRETKDHFPARQWSLFLSFSLTILSQSPVHWQGYHLGQIWPAP